MSCPKSYVPEITPGMCLPTHQYVLAWHFITRGFQLSPALHRGTAQSSAVPASAAGIAWMAVWGDFSLLFPP